MSYDPYCSSSLYTRNLSSDYVTASSFHQKHPHNIICDIHTRDQDMNTDPDTQNIFWVRV